MHCFARCNCRLRINNSHGMVSAIARLPVIVCGNRSRGLLQELQPRPQPGWGHCWRWNQGLQPVCPPWQGAWGSQQKGSW